MADDLSTSLISGAIRFTGLGSGTDFDALVTQLVEVEKTRSKQLQSWRAQWEAKSEAFDELSAAMLALNSSLQTMNTTDEFLIKSVNSSNSAALTATASSNAEEGTHDVEIVSLASNDMHVGTEIFSASDAVVGAGTFTFSYGNRQISVETTDSTTLSQFASLINTDADNPNSVRASVINDGSGYRLQIRGMDLGAGNDFLVDDSLTTLAGFSSADFIQTQNAGNAQLRVDGWPTLPPTATADILTATISGKATTDAVSTSDTTFKFTHGGTLHTVAMTAGETYADLAARITADTGVTAVATDVSGNVELTLTGDPGSTNQITIVNSPGTTITELQSSAFTQIQGATDGYIERQTNAVSDVVTGVTMTLLKAGETTTLATGIDAEAIVEKVRTFVDDVNSVLTVIRSQTKIDSVGENVSGSILTGNYGVQMIQQNLKNILAQRGVGFDYDTDPVISLGSVGITTDTSEGSPTFGLLTFDESAFSSALESNADSVARLFSADYYPSTKEMIGGEAVTSPNFKFDSFVRGVTSAGDFTVTYTVSGGTIAASPPPTINGYTANIDGNKLIAIGGDNAARGLAVEIINLTDGTYTGQVQLKSGKTEELSTELEQLTDSDSGTLNILKNNYQDIMDSIDDKLDYESRRLTLLESNLRQRFANLEAVLGTYDSIQSQLESQIKSLSSSS